MASLEEQLAASKRREADLQMEVRKFMDVANQNATERNEAWESVKTLEDALTKIAGYFDVPDWVKRKALEARREGAEMNESDLIRENAELRASDARLREALGACKRVVPYFGSTSGRLAYDLAAKVLAESPAQSLAAIQDAARAEEWKSIDTAPPGRVVLMFAITDEATGNWKTATGHKSFDEKMMYWDGQLLDKPYHHQPTHWHLLPEPPIRNRGNGGEAKAPDTDMFGRTSQEADNDREWEDSDMGDQ